MELRMNGRNALITGGSKGSGAPSPSSFAEAGANVALVARQQKSLDEAQADVAAAASNAKVITVAADVGTADGCRSLRGRGGRRSVRSMSWSTTPAPRSAGPSTRSPTSCGSTTSISSCSPRSGCAAPAFPGMKSRRWGRIINVLNTGAKAPQANGAPTAVTRAAGMALTKVLAGEGAPHNVLVNGLLVGQHREQPVGRRHANEGKGRSMAGLLRRDGQTHPAWVASAPPQEFANMALFLASDAGSYVTGTAINIDGDLTPVV